MRLFLAIVSSLLLSACVNRTSGPVPLPFPRLSESKPVRDLTKQYVPPDGRIISEAALSLQHVPYKAGGKTPAGFDCSGLVYYVFNQHGIDVPRQVVGQFNSGIPINREQIEPGDLLFFATETPQASHVAVSIGRDEFVHAPRSRGHVRIERMTSRYWASRFVGARRLIRKNLP